MEVQECYLVSGNFDYLIKVRLPDMAAYRVFLEESLLSTCGARIYQCSGDGSDQGDTDYTD